MIKISRAVFALGLLLSLSLATTAQMSTTFPLHTGVRHGVLDNGMNYYILHNEEPKERASFFFVQNVGAMQEEDSQNGLAHFLEHMAFNGTKHFEGKGIINFLLTHGVRFGYEINAYTAPDQTVYNLSNIPINAGEGLLDSCLLVMHDWSGYLSLKPDEIEAERGVIREEWRTRRNSQFRISAQTSKVIFKDSKYADRDVIGDLDVINNFKHEELQNYYATWYRPDQQAVVVVGDIDVDEVERKVIDRFSSIPFKENLPERNYFSIPDNEELLFGTAKDPEAQIMVLMLLYKSDLPKKRNEESYKIELIQNCYSIMLNMRFQEFQQDPDSKSLMAQSNFMPISRLSQGFAIQAIPKPGNAISSFSEVYSAVEKVKRFGFNASELERVKQQLTSQFDNFLQNKDKITHDNWATQLGNHFLQAEPVFEPEREYEVSLKILETITLDDVNAYAAKVQTPTNQVMLVIGPEKEDLVYPTEAELRAVMDEVHQMKLEAYEDEASDEPLIASELKSGKIVSEFNVAGIADAKGYTLENGAKVVLLETDFPEDQVLFTAFSPGGQSLISAADLPSADLATTLASFSGLGSFDRIALQKKLTGKIANVSPYIANYYEGLSGNSNQADFETMLQLAHLYFANPRFDQDAFQVLLNQMNTILENRDADNNSALQDTISLLTSNYHPRTLLLSKELLKELDFETASSIFTDRLSNASDFTFVFAGKLPDGALELVQHYIGSIPGNGSSESFIDHQIGPANGNSGSHFERKMEVPKTTVYLQVSKAMKHDQKTAIVASILGKLLDKRYMETIREEEGGSYGVSVGASLSRIPVGKFFMTVSFDTDPIKREHLIQVVWREINMIKNDGPIESDLEEIKKSFVKLRKEQLDKNGFWHGAIQSVLKSGNPHLSISEYEALVNSITTKDIQKFAKKALKNPDVVEVLMNPKEE